MLLVVPVRLRLHWGFLASGVIGLLVALWGVGVAMARRDLAALDSQTGAAAAAAIGSLVVDSLLDRAGQLDDDERGSVRVGSLRIELDRTCLSLWFARRCVGLEVDPATLVAGRWVCARATELRAAAALCEALDALGARAVAFHRDRLLLDAYTNSIDEFGESYTLARYAGVLLPGRAVFLPADEVTWRAALGDTKPLVDEGAATLALTLGCLGDDELAAAVERAVAVGDALTFEREELRSRLRRHGRWLHVDDARLVIALKPGEPDALDAWFDRPRGPRRGTT